MMECEGCGEAAPAQSSAAGNGGKSGGGFVVGMLKSAEAVPGKDKLKVGALYSFRRDALRSSDRCPRCVP